MPLAWGEGTADSYHAGLFLLAAVGLQSSGNLAKWRRECEESSCWQEKDRNKWFWGTDWVEKAEIQAFLCPFPCIRTWMSAPCGAWVPRGEGWSKLPGPWCALHPLPTILWLCRGCIPQQSGISCSSLRAGDNKPLPTTWPTPLPRHGRRESWAPELLDDNPVESSVAVGGFWGDAADCHHLSCPRAGGGGASPLTREQKDPQAPGAGRVQQHLPGRQSRQRGWHPLKSFEPLWGEGSLSPPGSNLLGEG